MQAGFVLEAGGSSLSQSSSDSTAADFLAPGVGLNAEEKPRLATAVECFRPTSDLLPWDNTRLERDRGTAAVKNMAEGSWQRAGCDDGALRAAWRLGSFGEYARGVT